MSNTQSVSATNTPESTGQAPAPEYVYNGEIEYDLEDIGLNREELVEKYASTGEHDYHDRNAWGGAVRAGSTQEYWGWVMAQIAQDDEDY